MQKLIALLLIFFSFQSLKGQKIETIYLDKTDSSRNRYIIVHPPSAPSKYFLFLIPGMFQQPQDVLAQSELPKYAAQQGILTIIPTFKTGISSFGIDSLTQASFLEILEDVRTRQKLKDARSTLVAFPLVARALSGMQNLR